MMPARSRLVRIACVLAMVMALVPLSAFAVAPAATAPTSFTSSVLIDTWTTETTIDVSWDGTDDGGTPVDGYSYVWSEGASATPNETIDTPVDAGTAISAGGYHTVALKADGSVVATGYNDYGQCDVSLWSDVVQVSAGYLHTVALKADGSVVATGDNRYGQCDVSSWSYVVQVSAGYLHTVALKADGTVVATGYNGDGQCDVSSWSDVVQVSAGDYHTVALKADGTVVATGYNDHGECDVSSWSDVVQVSAGGYHTVALKADGTLVAVGDNDHGQCDVSSWSDVVQVSAGDVHTVALKADGTVVAVGYNSEGQCDVSSWSDVVQVSVGNVHTVALKADGSVVAVGSNYYGQCDVSSWSEVVQVSAGNVHTVALKADGTVVAIGDNYYGQCDVSSWSEVVQVSAGGYHTVGLKADGSVVATGRNGDGQCDVSSWVPVRRPTHDTCRTGWTAPSDGEWFFNIRTCDTLGVWTSSASYGPFLIDTTAPVTTSDVQATYTDAAEITLSATDAGSGVAATYYILNGGSTTEYTAPIEVDELGSHMIEYWSVDAAGNEETHHEEAFEIVKGAVTYVPVQGDTRYETAVEASKDAFPAGATCVVIATGRNWPDALGGAALAGAKGGPILLVDTDAVPAAVAAEVVRLGATEAIILGGEVALGPDVFDALEGLVGEGKVTRIGGDNRFETARMVADAVVAINGATKGFVATGANFPDALAAAPISAANGWPIYLYESGTPAAMKADGMTDAVILGGTEVVSASAETALDTAFGASRVDRRWGENRYKTAVAVASYGCDSCGLHWDGVALATGTNFPDALSGGVLQGVSGSVMLLTPSTSLDPNVAAKLTAEAGCIREVRYLGGLGAISQAVRNAVAVILD